VKAACKAVKAVIAARVISPDRELLFLTWKTKNAKAKGNAAKGNKSVLAPYVNTQGFKYRIREIRSVFISRTGLENDIKNSKEKDN
jgi:hypothetical protein